LPIRANMQDDREGKKGEGRPIGLCSFLPSNPVRDRTRKEKRERGGGKGGAHSYFHIFPWKEKGRSKGDMGPRYTPWPC